MYDVIIIGGGPAGVAAGVYVARKKLNALLITESFGGQSIVSDDIQNWIGTPHISGIDLAKGLEEHVKAQETITVKEGELAEKVGEVPGGFSVATNKGNSYEGKTIILASGSRRKKLNVPGEKEFDGKGVAYCSTCDAPLFSGKRVGVVGSGNAGLEAVEDLIPYASEIFILEYSTTIKGDQVTQERIQSSDKLKGVMFNTAVKEVVGEKFITGVRYQDQVTKEFKDMPLEGLFVEIGAIPNSEMVKGLVDMNERGEVIIDSKNAKTSKEGIWAAGDVSDDPFKQNNISMGDAVKAALSCYQYLLSKK